MMSKPRHITSVSMTEEETRLLREIRYRVDVMGLGDTRTAAIRYAIRETAKQLGIPMEPEHPDPEEQTT